ncbi:MAG: response regulator [Candidatus Lokiarchaeota archaeon]|nr:response regulator [Candidatus Lokiarchaeota archaeon]
MNPLEILIIEDNPGDIRLIKEAFNEIQIIHNLHFIENGIEAILFLKKKEKYIDVPTPNFILLDLNLPKKNGFEVLKEIKQEKELKKIPVVILTISASEEDVIRSYEAYANCFIKKPVDMDEFIKIVQGITDFWFKYVKLPL